jgi:hypothetical protein
MQSKKKATTKTLVAIHSPMVICRLYEVISWHPLEFAAEFWFAEKGLSQSEALLIQFPIMNQRRLPMGP